MNLQNLIVCRNLLADKIFDNAEDEFKIAAKLIEQAENLGLSGNIFKNYLIYKLANEENLISETVEKNCGKVGESLKKIFVRDIEILLPIFLEENFPANFEVVKNYQPTEKNQLESFNLLEKNLSEVRDAEKIAEIFIEHYKKFGVGDIAACRAFRWDSENKNLVGIKNFVGRFNRLHAPERTFNKKYKSLPRKKTCKQCFACRSKRNRKIFRREGVGQ